LCHTRARNWTSFLNSPAKRRGRRVLDEGGGRGNVSGSGMRREAFRGKQFRQNKKRLARAAPATPTDLDVDEGMFCRPAAPPENWRVEKLFVKRPRKMAERRGDALYDFWIQRAARFLFPVHSGKTFPPGCMFAPSPPPLFRMSSVETSGKAERGKYGWIRRRIERQSSRMTFSETIADRSRDRAVRNSARIR